jgi:hypothetical protein
LTAYVTSDHLWKPRLFLRNITAGSAHVKLA